MTGSEPHKRTDKEILDWMAREGLESLIRAPQFDRDGNSLHVCFWTCMQWPDQVFVSLRGAAMAADAQHPMAVLPPPPPRASQPARPGLAST